MTFANRNQVCEAQFIKGVPIDILHSYICLYISYIMPGSYVYNNFFDSRA